ncbi:MAG: hypothetical protein AAFX90_19165 [Pseudomonadota bacterium]
MSLMERIYAELQEHSFVHTAEQFSTDWCWRSKSWFAVQKTKQSDFSIPTAINCLHKTKIKIAFAHMSRKKLGSIADSDLRVLNGIKDELETYLLEHHKIAAIAGDDALPAKC